MLDVSAAFATFPALETPRLILRQPIADDAPAMFAIMSDPEVMRYFGSPPMSEPAQAAQRIADIGQAFAEHEGVRWAIIRRADGAFLGSGGFWRLVTPHFRAEIGYELGCPWWGQGFMPEALGAMLAFGFTTMGLHSVEATIDPANTGSRRVLEKLGFVQEALFHENYYELHTGRFTDSAVFSLLRTDWQARASPSSRLTERSASPRRSGC